ncbi:MAG: histidinol dehydrogenase [Clostridiales bacterium]|nr:histidinol dehydrogenase [Clostridiales bacterium]
MSIKIVKDTECAEALASMRRRAGETGEAVERAVKAVIADVLERRDEAVREYTAKFDRYVPERFELDPAEMEKAVKRICPELLASLVRAEERIRAFHKNEVSRSWMTASEDGSVMGQVVRGLSRVGVYVPGGTAAYPSSVLMNIVPAKLAGVEEVIVATPPFLSEESRDVILAAASVAGADRVFNIGGAQAVAALAYGTESIPRCDKITGPGNAFVACAKRLVFGAVDIDMVAGPSEILVIADRSADPAFAAADMLGQAEHGELSSSVLLTTDRDFALKVEAELSVQLAKLPRKDIAGKSIDDFGLIVICESLDSVFGLANEIAPEHLEVMLPEPMKYLPRIKNAGSIFLGSYSPEALGDYMAGPNHILPTGGTARFASPLGVESFQKRSSFIMADKALLSSLSDDIVVLAESEGLGAHAESIRVRRGR